MTNLHKMVMRHLEKDVHLYTPVLCGLQFPSMHRVPTDPIISAKADASGSASISSESSGADMFFCALIA